MEWSKSLFLSMWCILISIKKKASLLSLFEWSILISFPAQKNWHWSTCSKNRKQTSFLWNTLFNLASLRHVIIKPSHRNQGRMCLRQAILNKNFIVQKLNIHIYFLYKGIFVSNYGIIYFSFRHIMIKRSIWLLEQPITFWLFYNMTFVMTLACSKTKKI